MRVYGETTTGNDYVKADDMESEYDSPVTRPDGGTVTVNDVLDWLKGKINSSRDIYNKDDITFKHKGKPVEADSDLEVSVANSVIEFYLKRKIRTITLETDKAVTYDKVKGAVAIDNINKKIKFRHGYKFVSDETPVSPHTNEYEFAGWELGSSEYLFKNSNEVIGDITLTMKINENPTVNITGFESSEMSYDADGIKVSQVNGKITFRVRYSLMPYTLKNLTLPSGTLLYDKTTHKPIKQNGYSVQQINAQGVHNVTVTYQDNDVIYKGYYPQTKKGITGEIKDYSKSYSLMYGTFNVITSYKEGVKYEKIGSDYYLYEPVESELFPACEDGQKWTVNTIDISIFHEYKDNSNIYANSYIKQYLEQVVKAKLQATSVSLPKLKNTTTDVLALDEAKKYSESDSQKQALKYKKTTDYATAVRSNYKSLRGISINIYEGESYSQFTWLGTRYSGSSGSSYHVSPSGALDINATSVAFGLRSAVSIWFRCLVFGA